MFEILPRKFVADFHSKMSLFRHELGGGSTPPTPTFQPWYYDRNLCNYKLYKNFGNDIKIDIIDQYNFLQPVKNFKAGYTFRG